MLVPVECLAQVLLGVLGVDLLGRVRRGVPENVLHLGELGAGVEQHTRLQVAQVVRGDLHPGQRPVLLDDQPHRLGRKAPPLAAEPGLSTAVVVADEERHVDEAHFYADADLRGRWVLKGQPALVDSTGPRWGEKASYYSAVCPETGAVETMELD